MGQGEQEAYNLNWNMKQKSLKEGKGEDRLANETML